jgi:hypothetical protein
MGIVKVQVAPLAMEPPLNVKALELVPLIVPPQVEVPAPKPVVAKITLPLVLKASEKVMPLTGSTLLLAGLVMAITKLDGSPMDIGEAE